MPQHYPRIRPYGVYPPEKEASERLLAREVIHFAFYMPHDHPDLAAGVAKVSDFGRYVEIKMTDGADPQSILKEAAARLRLSRFEIVEPSLHDIFVASVKGEDMEAA